MYLQLVFVYYMWCILVVERICEPFCELPAKETLLCVAESVPQDTQHCLCIGFLFLRCEDNLHSFGDVEGNHRLCLYYPFQGSMWSKIKFLA
jgi:hypothetical protein